MTPKDKVTELMQKFYHFQTDGELPQPFTKKESKELSLFVCEQVIRQEALWIEFHTEHKFSGEFWKQVKSELEQL